MKSRMKNRSSVKGRSRYSPEQEYYLRKTRSIAKKTIEYVLNDQLAEIQFVDMQQDQKEKETQYVLAFFENAANRTHKTYAQTLTLY